MAGLSSSWIIGGLVAIFIPMGLSAQSATPNTQKISLPTGPGSIDGLGESFEPQLNTGTFTFSIPLKVTVLRGQAQPSLSLNYNSGGGNGPAGMGWAFKVPFVQRQTDKGLPDYTDADTFIEANGEELVRLADGTFREENEGRFTKWENLGAAGWRATLNNGTVMRYGASVQARQNHATLGTFKWMLESVQDTNGNRAEYRYLSDQGQIYLSEVEYGLHATEAGGSLKVTLQYADGRPDPFADYRGRFRCMTGKRLVSVTAWQGTRRLRHWELQYHSNYHLSLLKSFVVFGDQRSNLGASRTVNTDYLPPLELDYSRQEFGQNWQVVTMGPYRNVSFAQGEADWVDLNGDALPDLIYYDSGNYVSMLNRGSGQDFGPEQPFTSGVFLPPLTEPGVRIADWRGDARAKVMIPEGGSFYYRDFTSPTTVGVDVDYLVPGFFPLTDPTVQMVDINNDRALDLVAPSFNRFAFVLSSPSGGAPFFEEGPPTDLAETANFADGWQFADLNGDRIPDLAVIGTVQDGGTVYYPHQGLGEFDQPVTMTGGPTDAELGPRGRAGLSLVDLDLDGLADLVLVDSGRVVVWPNRGGLGWGQPVSIVSAQIPSWNEGATLVRFLDMNGNGSVDIVWNDPSNNPGAAYLAKYLELHPGTKPNQLTWMSNGMGKTLEIEYKSSVEDMLEDSVAGTSWTVKPPFPMQVVGAFTEKDGMGSTYRTEIRYRNGFYDAMEREFRGFEHALRTDVGNAAQGAPSLVTDHWFHTGQTIEALKGRPRRVERREVGGAAFDRVDSNWQARLLPLTTGAGEERKVTFCFQSDETTEFLEKGQGAPVSLFKEMEWDNYGNQIRLADYGRVEGANRSAWDDERVVTRSFTSAFATGITHWILNLPVEETIADEHGQVQARTLHFYDDETFSPAVLGAVSKGNLTMKRRALDAAAGTWITEARQRYDPFGNPTHAWDPLGDPGNAALGHFRVFSYDAELHTYAEEERIFLGSQGAVPSLAMTASYDKGLGVMSASTNFAGHVTEYVHDTFGRLASLIKPGDSEAAPTEEYVFRLGMQLPGGRTINWIETRQREQAGGGTIDSRLFFDGLGRKIMRRAEGEDAGQLVVTDTVVFNDRRTEWKTYLPYFENGSTLDFKDPTFATPFQEKRYDAVGRQVALHQPDTGNGRPFARTVFEPLARWVQDEEQTRPGSPHFGCGMRYIEDGLRDDKGSGRLRSVEEWVKLNDDGTPAQELQSWTTRYRYDLLDNFTGYTDSRGNEKSFLYDGLSRRVFMQDPDRGPYWWAYDDGGNVLRTCDAKGQHLVFAYDGVNRLLSEWHLVANEGGLLAAPGQAWTALPPQPVRAPEVQYHYDMPAGPISREAFWRPQESAALAKVVLEQLSGGSAADVNQDGAVDVRDVVLRAGATPTGPAITASNTLGIVAWVSDQSGEEHLSYDERGRAVWKVKRIQPPGTAAPYSFYVENAYDSADRLKKHVYADGTFVEYQYNSRGLLEAVTGAIDRVDYNPAGQNARIDLTNGVRSSYIYDNRLRLRDLQSMRVNDGLVLRDLRYGYDAISNISAIADRRSSTARTTIRTQAGASDLSPADLLDSMAVTYDSLYRVTQVNGPAVGAHHYRFDPLGNLISHQYEGDQRFAPPGVGAMSYGGSAAGPHALSGVTRPGGSRYQLGYDTNGNLTANGEGAVMSYDPKDRLSAASEAGVSHDHIYDYGGKRTIHRMATATGKTTQTFYIDNVSEFRDDRLVKYIYVGSEKVARCDFSAQAGEAVSADQFYIHDHLGSTQMALGQAGQVRQISSYTPYGHDRLKGLGGAELADYSFSGKENHDHPDLSYFETRFLSSGQARFTQTDTLTLNPLDDWRMSPQKWHSYSYCWGNPVTMVDKDGRKAEEADSAFNFVSSSGQDSKSLEAIQSQIDEKKMVISAFEEDAKNLERSLTIQENLEQQFLVSSEGIEGSSNIVLSDINEEMGDKLSKIHSELENAKTQLRSLESAYGSEVIEKYDVQLPGSNSSKVCVSAPYSEMSPR